MLSAQFDEPCLPEGIVFSSQAEIDSFQVNYPNCTEIEGDVKITGDDITNLYGLSYLTAIGGRLWFHRNPVLSSLSGLENLDTIRGNLRFGDHPSLLGGNPALSNMTGLNGLKHIANLIIYNNDGLVSLSGLEGLSSSGYIKICYNNSLISLTGLNNVDSIENLFIFSNDALINLAGLDNLVSILGSISIMGNDNLISLTGLENLRYIAEDVAIGGPNAYDGNYAILNLNGLNNLDSIGGLFSIANNSLLSSLTGLDSLTFLGGDLQISGNQALTSLSGLDNLTAGSIDNLLITENSSLEACAIQSICNYLANPNGAVTIHSNATGCNNPPEIANACGINLPCLPYGNYYFFTQSEIDDFPSNYQDCNELEGLVDISGANINNLDGLYLINSIGGHLLIDNTSLLDLNGLENLSTIGSSLVIESNNSLTSIATLSNLNSINESLRIRGNNSLTSLIELENLTMIGSLDISGNPLLESLTGLENIDGDSIIRLRIFDNGSLSMCGIESICNYLSDPNLWWDVIDNNAPGCNSLEEVQDSCWVTVEEIPGISEITIHPNPFSTSTIIEFETTLPERVEIRIFNQLGELIELIQKTAQTGKQQVVWNAEGIPGGVYYCALKTENGMETLKMIKLK